MNDRKIRRFVRDTLGCTCPDEVFRHVDCQAGVNVSQDVRLDYEINVGNRLLIYLVAADDAGSLRPLISQLVREGTGKRDRENFNRFRLVLVTEEPADTAENASAIFHSLGADEKVHLHVVGKDGFSA